MHIQFIDQGFDSVLIDNCYSPEELAQMQREMRAITLDNQFLDSSTALKTAQDSTDPGRQLASRKGTFLDERIKDWRTSHLIRNSRLKLMSKDLEQVMVSHNSLYRIFFADMARSHLLNYYEHNDYYDWHDDSMVFTVLNWFCVEPQAFTGGEFGLRNHQGEELKIEFKNNRVLIIPSCTLHKVYPVSLPNNPKECSGLGRYTLTVFVSTWPSEDHPGRYKR